MYGFLFFVLEVLKRKKILTANATRRIIHIVSVFIAYTFPYYLSLLEILILCSTFLIFLIFSKNVSLLESIHKVERITWGEIFFPIGIAVASVFFLPGNIYNYTIVLSILGISDLLANIVGMYFGTHSFAIFKCKKTLEGSMAFLLSSLLILLIFNINLPILTLVLISIVVSIVEFLSPYGSDNLSIPIVLSILLLLFSV